MKETIVVGGSVGGNISSCEFKVNEIITGRDSLFVITKQSMAVNNCTGEIIKSNYWTLDDNMVLGTVFLLIISTVILSMVAMFIKDFIIDRY